MNSDANASKILVTGASGGIGSAAVEELSKRGASIITVDRAEADLSSYDDVKKLGDNILHDQPLLDWIVFAHGFIDSELDFSIERKENIEATFAINTLSIIYLTQMLLPILKKGVVFVSSTTAIFPSGRHAVYSASKAAVNGFAQALAKNRPERIFIAICPGPTNTPMREKVATDAASSQPPSAVAHVIAEIVDGSSAYKSGDIVVVKNGTDLLHASLKWRHVAKCRLSG